jgi:hypothetical protein
MAPASEPSANPVHPAVRGRLSRANENAAAAAAHVQTTAAIDGLTGSDPPAGDAVRDSSETLTAHIMPAPQKRRTFFGQARSKAAVPSHFSSLAAR